MKIALLSFAFILTFGCKPSESTREQAHVIESAIVNGVEVNSSLIETRYIVSISNSCAGSIIAPQWILTAGHCEEVFKKISAGSTNLYDKKRISLKMKKYFIHPKYRSFKDGSSYDFALIELKEPINFEQTGLTSIKIADPEFVELGGMNEGLVATVFGWGATYEGEKGGRSKLRQVDVLISNFAKSNSKKSYNGKLDESMFAAGDPEGKKDSCNGDSGGPLTMPHPSTGDLTLVGLVSWGDVCASKNHPGIYSNIAHVHKWILKTIN